MRGYACVGTYKFVYRCEIWHHARLVRGWGLGTRLMSHTPRTRVLTVFHDVITNIGLLVCDESIWSSRALSLGRRVLGQVRVGFVFNYWVVVSTSVNTQHFSAKLVTASWRGRGTYSACLLYTQGLLCSAVASCRQQLMFTLFLQPTLQVHLTRNGHTITGDSVCYNRDS